ncbi:diguanylate cyclase domain-containing protein [Duganella violaceipulchra]|uniref:Diguanylate cyclase (GGDEF)-like protein/PAS domain S-box-containing protein n=2 Tax=Duganella violaceipulchra TaxID=2849652 RepID=A0ABT1GDH3_9BURK|nr:diguanylate cyclase [Duganella violaceicalia]MCP2007005.1 diguanylate cyclase (GGDEF)-like protein/PAS domain S-box-containing protein [Duganella violaceicalia]
MAVLALLPRSLKFRMTVVVVMLVLVATVIVTWVALVLAERDMKSVIGNQQYALLSSAAAQVDAQITAKKALLASLADAMPADAGQDPERMSAFVARHPAVRKAFLNLHIFNRNGVLIHTEGEGAAVLALDERPRAFMQKVLAGGRVVVSPPFKSILSGLPAIMILHPVLDAQGKAVMLLGGSIDLSHSDFLAQIAAQKPGKTGYMFIMTTGGILVHHPNPKRLLEHINARPGYNRATEMALQGFEGWTEAANKDGSEGIYSYKHLSTTNWIIGARFPVDEAFAPMIEMRRHAMLAAGAFAALAGLMAWLAIQALLKPLGRLRRNISDIRSGDVSIGVLQRRRRDEIGELSSAFHELMAERELAQEAIRDSESLIAASEKRLRMIADSIPAIVAYIDRDNRYHFTNEYFRTMLGLDPQAMIGRTMSEVLGKDFVASIAPYHDAAMRGDRVHYEREGRKDGIPQQVMGDLIPDIAADGSVAGVYLMAVDITERKSAELRQAASEKRLKLLTDNLPVLISYLDHKRRFQFVNATFFQWFGVEPDKLIGRHLVDGIGRDHYEHAEAHLEQAYRGHNVTYELKAQIDGSLHTLETTFVPELAADGTVVGIYSLTHDTTRMKEIEERLTQLARIDSLTGIANRLMFEEILQLAVLRSRRNRRPLALAYLDIDHFKNINDTLGHGAGDSVLKEFASRLVGNVRASDTVARLAGDEFVIVLEQVDGPGECARLAAKIIESVRRPFDVAGQPMRITTSIGIALHERNAESPAELIARADGALYAAKRKGRDGYALAN